MFLREPIMEVQRSDKRKGLIAVKGIFTVVLIILIIIGTFVLGGCNRKKQSVVTIPTTPAQVEEKKEDPAFRLAATEKISGYAHPEALISVYDLNQKIYDPGTFILDTRGRSYAVFQSSYPQGHIPGAVPILHEHYSHPTYTGRIAPPLQLQNLLGGLGVSNDSAIVLYGNDGLQARLYWALKMYGYDNVKILDGGLDKWKEAGYDITPANSPRRPETFEFDLDKSKTEQMLASMTEVKAAVGSGNYIIVDARYKDDYSYRRIPGSVNLYYAELLNSDQTFKPAQDLKALAEGKNIVKNKNIIVYCDSGVSSSLVWFALSELLGYPSVKLYDGALYEWVKQGCTTDSNLNKTSQ
ncbi:Thiosulfate sulfurtransferase [Pelotomaculum propionicicum]|uniref:thiosulfate sulfurtransferase n=2 Tax=Pelotomaculum propionicicum TaxID=258475 RepID=A0A4Y7RL51_9FIRM|nr:Thiosulfate sulfurtransferase [Pelotomaculum propionicicum]